MNDFIGKNISGYEVKKEIGRGGMAVVLLAENKLLNTKVAIKVIHRHLTHLEEQKARFRREAVIQSRLSHPNLVKLINYIEENDDSFILMEYFDSKPLNMVIGKEIGPLPFETKAHPIFKQILNGIGYAHEKNVIHRDIKPSNILIDENDEIKITDFGIARPDTGEDDLILTASGTKVGTSYYMSPEQVKGIGVDYRTDIYSLGITFYEALTGGKVPFPYQNEFELEQAIAFEDPPDPKEHYPHIPEHVVNTIMKSLSKDPKDRQQSCSEFISQLDGKSKVSISRTKKIPTKKSSRHNKKKPSTRKNQKQSSPNFAYVVIGIIAFLGLILFFDDTGSGPTRTGKPTTIASANCNYEKGTDYYESGKFRLAIDVFAECLKADENNHAARLYRGWSYYNEQDLESALYDANILVSKRGNGYDYYLRGKTNYWSDNFDAAISDFTQCIQKEVNKAESYYNIGYSNYAQSNWSQSIKNFNNAIDLFKDNGDLGSTLSDSYRGRALSNFEIGEKSKAISDITNAIKYDKKNGLLYLNRGTFFYRMNRMKKACKDWYDACELGDDRGCGGYDDYCK